jgi:hypothetical protein
MDIDEISKKYKLLVLNTVSGECNILPSDRQVTKILKEKYNIELSHMYIRRHLQSDNHILEDKILIKNIW